MLKSSKTQLKLLQNCRCSKLAFKKNLDLLGSRLLESLLFRRPGFDSETAQALRAYNLTALCPIRVQITSFESPDKYLLGLRKKNSLATLLTHISLD